jgi:iron complex outermembrane receptor protein
MRSISLGYTFKHLPESIAKLRIYIAGNNVFTITPYKGIDPEIKNTDSQAYIDSRDYYPATRSFSFGVNVAFK